MPASNQYQSLVRARIASAIEQARQTSLLTHQGVKGAILETLIGQLFTPLLPADMGVGTGQIIESYGGELSNQIDIVLYDRSILPPILYDGKLGIFPIEAVLYTIEVKTTLTANELKTAHESAERLATKFGYRPGKTDEHGKAVPHAIEKVRSVIFALNSDLTGTGMNEAERYKRVYGDGHACLRAICVAGREYWFDNGDFWVGTKDHNQFDEILAFLGGVTNTYRSIASSRSHPALGTYIIPEFNSVVSVKSRDVASVSVTCDSCSLEGQLVPNVPAANITVNGALIASEKCPRCGGTMRSASGTYEFKDSKLLGQAK